MVCCNCQIGCCIVMLLLFFFLFLCKQKTAYEMRISDWSSDVCSSDLRRGGVPLLHHSSDDHRRRGLVSAASRCRRAARLPDPARRDRAGMLAFLCDRAQHRLAAAADRIAAQGGEGVMGALKGILAIVGVAMILVGGLWALPGLDIIRWPARSEETTSELQSLMRNP